MPPTPTFTNSAVRREQLREFENAINFSQQNFLSHYWLERTMNGSSCYHLPRDLLVVEMTAIFGYLHCYIISCILVVKDLTNDLTCLDVPCLTSPVDS